MTKPLPTKANKFWSNVRGDHSRRGEYSVMCHFFYTHGAASTLPRDSHWVVDIGAYGVKNSNSYDLISRHAWQGLLVDASPVQAKSCKNFFPGGTRVECAAISDFEGKADFYINATPGNNSLLSTWKPRRRKQTIKVPVIKLETLLRRNKVPKRFGALSVDTEGNDEKVIRPLLEETDWRPDFLIVERPTPEQQRLPWADLLEANGYALYWHFRDNWLWVRVQQES